MFNLSLQGEKITIFEVEDKIEAMIKKLELWYNRVSNRNYETFPNLTNFLSSTDEVLSEDDILLIARHLKDLQHSFREYFPIPNASKNWIRDPFSVNVNGLKGLTAAEEDKLIEISTDGALKLQFKEHFQISGLTYKQIFRKKL